MRLTVSRENLAKDKFRPTQAGMCDWRLPIGCWAGRWSRQPIIPRLSGRLGTLPSSAGDELG